MSWFFFIFIGYSWWYEHHPVQLWAASSPAPGRAELDHELAHLTAWVDELDLEKVGWDGRWWPGWDFTKRTIKDEDFQWEIQELMSYLWGIFMIMSYLWWFNMIYLEIWQFPADNGPLVDDVRQVNYSKLVIFHVNGDSIVLSSDIQTWGVGKSIGKSPNWVEVSCVQASTPPERGMDDWKTPEAEHCGWWEYRKTSGLEGKGCN